MGAQIIDGVKISQEYRQNLKSRIAKLKQKKGITPGLAVILVGDSDASQTYVRNKAKACEELGLFSQQYDLPEQTSENELLDLIDKLNNYNDIHGILIQFPLPKHINVSLIMNRISPQKDVDAFGKENIGSIMMDDYKLAPCTPSGVLELLKSTGIAISGKDCVIVGRSDIVGKPLAMLMLHEDATVTICHSKTNNLKDHCLRADILVSAVGIPNTITKDMVKPGAVVVDVGINLNENGELCGDVDFKSISEVASFITPVPGGVGPMTITMLMSNTVAAAEQS